MNISMSNCWATLRDVVSTVFERKDPGEFLFIKEPQSVTYRLIKMTEEESEEEEDVENDEDNQGL